MPDRPVHLHPEPDAGGDPSIVCWRVGPGLVRFTGDLRASELPSPVRRLFDDEVLTAVTVSPGRVVTRLAPGRAVAADGAAVRSALFEVLSAPDGWPDPRSGSRLRSTGNAADTLTDTSVEPTLPAESIVRAAADREIAAAVSQVLTGEFGSYTESHGGLVELLGVRDGVVRVVLSGRCHGCAYADNTIRQNLTTRLTPIPGFRSLDVADDHDCVSADNAPPTAPSSRIRRRVSMGLPRLRRTLNPERRRT